MLTLKLFPNRTLILTPKTANEKARIDISFFRFIFFNLKIFDHYHKICSYGVNLFWLCQQHIFVINYVVNCIENLTMRYVVIKFYSGFVVTEILKPNCSTTLWHSINFCDHAV